MSQAIEQYVSEGKYVEAMEECVRTDQRSLALLLSKIVPDMNSPRYISIVNRIMNEEETKKDSKPVSKTVYVVPREQMKVVEKKEEEKIPKVNYTTIKLLCNWDTTKGITECWNKMSKGDYTWNNIRMITDGEPDYYVIINKPPPDAKFDKKKTIVFRMEPHMGRDIVQWGEWADPKDEDFLKVFRHKNDHNNVEWHLSRTYNELTEYKSNKNPEFDRVLSTVLSGKYRDPGHIKRIDFVKFLEKKGLPVHVYGSNRWDYKDYRGSLPPRAKEVGVVPYKYTFNVENHSIPNYFTEKLVDGILSESLTFYSGCFNVREFIDERAFVYLELSNFEKDYEIIKTAIEEDWYSKRLPFILEAKKRILNELQFFPRLEKFLNTLK